MKFGEATSSYDAEGELTGSLPVPLMTLDQLNAAAATFIGDQMQVPPMVSAIKKDGVPLYKLARKGQTVEREPRLIHIYSFNLLDFAPPSATFRLRCTKGTYVRTLCSNIGDALGCGAHLSSLRRTESGTFRLADAVTLDDLLRLNSDELASRIIPSTSFSLHGQTA